MRRTAILLTAGALAALPLATADAAGTKNIVKTASANKDFSTLVSLLKSAGLVETLSGKGPFTVFAPTNAAFAKVPKATLTALGKDKALLTRVLTYHVVAGRVPAAKVVGLKSAKTVAGPAVKISVKGSTVKVGAAKVVATDVKATNGIIHVIDTVLIPPAK